MERYCLLTEAIAQDGRLSKLFVRFTKFLFCSICHVGCCVGAPPQEVNKAMRRISGGNAAYLDELRHGVVWQIEATDKLHEGGSWGMRSGDITFYC